MKTIEIPISHVIDTVATQAARHAFLDSVRAFKASCENKEDWEGMIAFVREEALDCAREAAAQIARDFNVRGSFDDDQLAFTCVTLEGMS